jgi:hypothetical protein
MWNSRGARCPPERFVPVQKFLANPINYWGKSPLPVADPAHPCDVISLNSPYVGVSWWYQAFTPPALQPGERLSKSGHTSGRLIRLEDGFFFFIESILFPIC